MRQICRKKNSVFVMKDEVPIMDQYGRIHISGRHSDDDDDDDDM